MENVAMVITIQNKEYIKAFMSSLILGVVEGMKNGNIKIEEAMNIVFSPSTMREFMSFSEVNEIIHAGTELEDIQSILPERLGDALRDMRQRCEEVQIETSISWVRHGIQYQAVKTDLPEGPEIVS